MVISKYTQQVEELITEMVQRESGKLILYSI